MTISSNYIRPRSGVGINGSEQFAKGRWVFFPTSLRGLNEQFKDNIDLKSISLQFARLWYRGGNDRLGETLPLSVDDVRVAYNQGYVNNGTVISILGAATTSYLVLSNLNLKKWRRRGSRTTQSRPSTSWVLVQLRLFREVRDILVLLRRCPCLRFGAFPPPPRKHGQGQAGAMKIVVLWWP